MNILLIVTLFILAGFGLVGMKTGLIKMMFSLVSTIVALLVAIVFSPTVANVVENNTGVHDFLTHKVDSMLEVIVPEADIEFDYIEDLPLPEVIKDVLRGDSSTLQAVSAQKQAVKAYVCERIASIIISSIAFAVTFLVALLVLIIVCRMLNLISKLPVLNEINHIAGLVAGLAEGVLVIWIFFIVLTVFAGTEFGGNAMRMISENAILSYLYDNNWLYHFILVILS